MLTRRLIESLTFFKKKKNESLTSKPTKVPLQLCCGLEAKCASA